MLPLQAIPANRGAKGAVLTLLRAPTIAQKHVGWGAIYDILTHAVSKLLVYRNVD
jgi:hypothetical protein